MVVLFGDLCLIMLCLQHFILKEEQEYGKIILVKIE